MLVLSRGPQDKVFFPRLGICVEVLRIANQQVRLGITAPKDVKIAREESYAAQIEAASQQDAVHSTSQFQTDSVTAARINAANQWILEAKQQLSASNSAEAMRLLNLALAEFDNIEHQPLSSGTTSSTFPGSSVQETRPRYSAALQILLLDNEDRSRQTLSQVLRLKGFDVTEVNDAFRAVYRLSGVFPVDAVVMDFTNTSEQSQIILQQMQENTLLRKVPVFGLCAGMPDNYGATCCTCQLELQSIAECFPKSSNPLDVAERLHRLLVNK